MGQRLLGRYASVKIGDTKILNLTSYDISYDTDDIDASVFGTGWGATMPGMQKWVANIAGFYDPSDTTGQMYLQSAKINGTLVTDIFFFFDASNYMTPNITADSDAGCYIGTQTIKQDKSGLAGVTFKVGGVGPPLHDSL